MTLNYSKLLSRNIQIRKSYAACHQFGKGIEETPLGRRQTAARERDKFVANLGRRALVHLGRISRLHKGIFSLGDIGFGNARTAVHERFKRAFAVEQAFDERRKYFYERVQNIPGVSCLMPEGAFYIFMNIKELLGKTIKGIKINNSNDFASAFLEKGLVAVVSGSAFGADGYVRWSYATSMENIKEGLDRLEKFLAD